MHVLRRKEAINNVKVEKKVLRHKFEYVFESVWRWRVRQRSEMSGGGRGGKHSKQDVTIYGQLLFWQKQLVAGSILQRHLLSQCEEKLQSILVWNTMYLTQYCFAVVPLRSINSITFCSARALTHFSHHLFIHRPFRPIFVRLLVLLFPSSHS